MLDSFPRSNTPATSIVPKYDPLQKSAIIQSNRNSRASNLSKQRQYSHRQHLRIERSDAKGSTCSPWDYRSPGKASSTYQDKKAARRVEKLISRPRKSQLAGRIFRNLITRRDQLDDDSIHGLLHAADKTIFGGSLSGRVCWEWSTGQPEYDRELLGTTAPRQADSSKGGFETLIILSKPLLKDTRFTRDLLISTFLHELIHSYLFIRCGLDHAKGDGHTEGFQEIAHLIDRYFGDHRLHLCNMQANLSYFLASASTIPRENYPLDWDTSGLDQPPRIEPLCDSLLDDEGYYSRDSSPGSIRSPRSPGYWVIN